MQPLAGVRKSAETDAAVQACNDWLRMGSGRSIAGLIEKYLDLSKFQVGYQPPSVAPGTLYTWSSKFDWPERASEYDSDIEMRKNRELRRVQELDIANPHGRIEKLIRLAEFLEGQIYERSEADETGKAVYHNVWVPDVKSVGSGDAVEIVDIERFNAPLIREFRATLDDIAKEVGGRVRKSEHIHQFTWVHRALDDLRDGTLTPDIILDEFGSLEDAQLAALEDTGGNTQLVEQFMALMLMVEVDA